MAETRETFTVQYRGEPMTFERIDGGWAYHPCPGGCCRAYHWIETDSGARHRITSAPGEPVTIVASLGCSCKGKGTPDGCRFHVMVENGVARDC